MSASAVKRIIGICMIASVFLLLFAVHAVQHGIGTALVIWSLAIVLGAVTACGLWLIARNS